MLYNEASRAFVMWVHVDEADYELARMGIATSARPEVRSVSGFLGFGVGLCAWNAAVHVHCPCCGASLDGCHVIPASALMLSCLHAPLGARLTGLTCGAVLAGPIFLPWQLPATWPDGA